MTSTGSGRQAPPVTAAGELRAPTTRTGGGDLRTNGTGWLQRASELLTADHPGPTPFLVESLIADSSLTVIQGPPKIGKTWLVLEVGISVATGTPVLGRFTVPHPGPVIVVVEESGQQALRRRLQSLCGGRGIAHDELHDLHVAANQRVRLDDPDWQGELIETARTLRPRAILFDPLVRLKGDERDEDSQQQMGPVLSFLRDLRDETDTTVAFVHHVGHRPGRLRGTSDLEAFWDSKLSLTRADGQVRLSWDHREAEASAHVQFRLATSQNEQAVRLLIRGDKDDLAGLISDYLERQPASTRDEVADGVGRRRQDVLDAIRELLSAGRLVVVKVERETRGQIGRVDGLLVAEQRTSQFPDQRNGSEPRNRTAEGRFPASAPLNGRRGEPSGAAKDRHGTTPANGIGEDAPSGQGSLFGGPSKGPE